MYCKFCGPKLSLCGILISIWGICQLAIMGICFHINSVLLIEDIGLEEEYESLVEFYEKAEKYYKETAISCWIASGIYIGILLISGQQFWANQKIKAAKLKKIKK